MDFANAFYYAESGKAGLLTDAVKSIKATEWSELPAEIYELEDELRGDLNYCRTQIIEVQNRIQMSLQDSAKVAAYEYRIFQLTRSLDSLIAQMEISYPEYYQLKYDNTLATVSQVQDFLEEDQAIVEYHIADDVAYVFAIGKDFKSVKKLMFNPELYALPSKCRTLLGTADWSSQEAQSDSLDIVLHRLYNLLIAPLEDDLSQAEISKLTIVPDAQLGYLPFEILLKDLPKTGPKNYANYDYLLKHYDIAYSFSSNLLLNVEKNGKGQGHISFAPKYELSRSLGKFRGAFSELEWNGEEAKEVQRHLGGVALTGTQATERLFKEKVHDVNIVHLAMHAFVDDQDPMQSKLIFYQNNDSIEDGLLHAFELYNMRFDAEMVVLSACETGYGKLLKGEGIASLARGFAYAGVPSLVLSHWQVDDRSTKEIMGLFYQNLAKGDRKSVALRRAKLTYLKTAPPGKGHPYYWGAFVVMGEDAPIKSDDFNMWIYLTFGTLLALSCLFLVGRWRRFYQHSSG